MKVIPPVALTDAMLVFSSIPENEGAVWAAGVSYAKDVRVVNAHRVYRSLQVGNTGHTPGATGNDAWWEDLGPTNRWAMLGDDPSYMTTAAESVTVSLAPGIVRAVCMPNVDANTARVTLAVAGELVFDSGEISLRDERHVVDAYTYFFSDLRLRSAVFLQDIPPYGSGVLSITLSRPGGTVSAAPVVLGPLATYGEDAFGVEIGVKDYSVVKFNDFGRATLSRRGMAKTVDVMLELPNDEVDRTFRAISALRATPALFVIGDGLFDCLTVYGIASFRINIPNAVKSRCSLTIQGLTQ